jgi:hypothetical protein
VALSTISEESIALHTNSFTSSRNLASECLIGSDYQYQMTFWVLPDARVQLLRYYINDSTDLWPTD